MFGPRGAEFGGEEVRLVEEEHGSFFRVEFLDERLEVGAPVKHGVPGVHHLHDDVAPLAHAPELAPDLEVLLERREAQALVFLDGGECAAPLEEVSSLVLVEHLGGHVFGPGRASGNLEAVGVELLGGALRLGRGGGTRLGDSGRERGVVRAVAHAHHDRAAPLGGEVAVAQLREREKLVEVVALHDGDEVGTAPPVGLEVGDVAVVPLLDVSPVVAADVRAVARGFPRQALSGRKGRVGERRIGVSDGSAAAPAPRRTRRDLRDAAGWGRRTEPRPPPPTARPELREPPIVRGETRCGVASGRRERRAGGRVSESGAGEGRLAEKAPRSGRSAAPTVGGVDSATSTVVGVDGDGPRATRARFIRTRIVDRLASVARCETAPRPSSRHSRRRARARSSLPRRGVPRELRAAPVRRKPLARRASNSRSPWRPRCSAS